MNVTAWAISHHQAGDSGDFLGICILRHRLGVCKIKWNAWSAWSPRATWTLMLVTSSSKTNTATAPWSIRKVCKEMLLLLCKWRRRFKLHCIWSPGQLLLGMVGCCMDNLKFQCLLMIQQPCKAFHLWTWSAQTVVGKASTKGPQRAWFWKFNTVHNHHVNWWRCHNQSSLHRNISSNLNFPTTNF